jgi:hypothetical protein
MTQTTGVTNAFRQSILQKGHDFTITTGLVYKMALVKASPAYSPYDQTFSNIGTPGSSAASATNLGTDDALVTNTGYTAGGFAWTAAQNISPTVSSNVAITSWSVNPSWVGTTGSLSVVAGIIYTNDAGLGAAGRTVEILDFGGTQTVVGTLTVVLPANASGTAVLRIA